MAKFKKIRRKMMWPVEAAVAYSMLYFIKILTFKGARRMGSMLGSIVLLIPSQKKLLYTNLKQAFPEKTDEELKKIGKKSVRGLSTTYIEFFWFYKSHKRLQKHIIISEDFKKKVVESRKNKKPAIFLAMHWGNWEFGSYGYKMANDAQGCAIARKFKNPFIEKLIVEGREFGGTKILHEKGAARGIVKSLKENIDVGMLVDQNTKTHQGGTYATFFGLPATISKLPAKLAMKMQTQVIITNCKRTDKGFEMCIDSLPKDIESYESEEELTQAMMSMMENFIRESPEQWIWLYNRWNYIPKNWGDEKDKFPYYAVIDERTEYPK